MLPFVQDSNHGLLNIQLKVKCLRLPAPILPVSYLPVTQPYLKNHAQEPCDANPTRVANRRRSKRKLTVLRWYAIADLRKSVNVYETAEQTLPENHKKDKIHSWNEIEE